MKPPNLNLFVYFDNLLIAQSTRSNGAESTNSSWVYHKLGRTDPSSWLDALPSHLCYLSFRTIVMVETFSSRKFFSSQEFLGGFLLVGNFCSPAFGSPYLVYNFLLFLNLDAGSLPIDNVRVHPHNETLHFRNMPQTNKDPWSGLLHCYVPDICWDRRA